MELGDSSVYFKQVLPEDLVDLMVKSLSNEKIEYKDGEIGNDEDSTIDLSVRNSKISWLEETHWISSIFFHYFSIANENLWNYDIESIEGVQVSKYDSSGHYSWHSDLDDLYEIDCTRKLSASLIVSDERSYTGGKLQLIDYHNNLVEPQQLKGSIIVFDSRLPHRVTPVQQGTRISLVSWALGPRLR